jgi:processive 1,2-diacylglycerol beta-glucosyltransferase
MPASARIPAVPRVLILTASIGEGHDLPARVLADGLRGADPGGAVEIVDGVRAMSPFLDAIAHGGSHPRLFELAYWLAVRFPPTRRLQSFLVWHIGHRGLLRAIRRFRPDLIVSTYPGVNHVLARLRARGAVRVPLVSAITDLSALRYWSMPGFALHLVTHEESIPEVRGLAGPETEIVCVRGLTGAAFDDPPAREHARRALGIPGAGPLAVVSGGGWGVGDLEGALRAVLAVPGARAIALCGRSEETKARLEAAFAAEPRVDVWGFTDRMADVLAAADVLVHSTAGLTVLEALACGTRVISYGWGAGHIRVNNRAFAEHGLAEVARTPHELAGALARALAAGPAPRLDLSGLPAAASTVLALVGGRDEAAHGRRGSEDRGAGGDEQHAQGDDAAVQGRAAPALAGEQGGEQDGHDGLDREDR